MREIGGDLDELSGGTYDEICILLWSHILLALVNGFLNFA